MIRTEDELRKEIVEVGRWVYERGYVAGYDGNISARLDNHRILSTPTTICKGMMTADDLVIVDYEGKKISGRRNVTSELAMHLLIYKRRSDAQAVVHAHPPTATGYAAAGMALNKALISEVVLNFGCIPLAAYGTPGTPELSEALLPLVGSYDAILMANHGVVTYGPDLSRAFFKMETVEHFAKISLVTELLGRQVLLSDAEVDKLLSLRAGYFGPGTPAVQRNAICPVTESVASVGTASLAGNGARPVAGSGYSLNERFWVSREDLEAMVADAIEGKAK
ncbi:MAG TPA: class II aldolase/adducin family protein [Terriglobia bacterium]|nr:class II aldolase/adducin family protein [Terriglobia bacterium]